MDPTNRERSERAQELMVVYSDMVGERPDMEILVRDVLTDLFHALGAESMHRAIDMAETHYESEVQQARDEMTYCDNCGRELETPSERYVFPSVPVDVDSANAGESATLCRLCAYSVAERAPTWFDADQHREDSL